jgi:signal transduction histidine kinase
MTESTVRRKTVLDILRTRSFYLSWGLLSLFALCCLFYYFGELLDLTGWKGLRLDFFYGVHDVHRLLFLIPIVYAGYFYRVKGALIVTIAALLVCMPRALNISPYPDALLRMVFFAIAAAVIGSLTGVVRNGSERQSRLERQLTSERDKLFGILETMDDGVCIIGQDYRIRYMNPRMAGDFGEGVGCHCYECLHSFDSPCDHICELPDVIAGRTARWEYALPDGHTYEVVASPFVDSDNYVCQLATFRNITERKQVEQELVKLSQLKSDLLSNVSHELKSPLTSIKGIISSLLQTDITWNDEDREMLLNGVSQETDRLASLVGNLLNMSKLEAGVWRPEKERCHIGDVIDAAMEHEAWVNQKHIFNIQIDPDLPEIEADYGQIRQVLINLLENAAAYSPEGTQITVEAKAVCDEMQVSVSDEGEGIRHEDLRNIFEKFYRGGDKRTRPGGTGLGLAVCKAIVLAHEGRIWAENGIGPGSTFRFRLPLFNGAKSEADAK